MEKSLQTDIFPGIHSQRPQLEIPGSSEPIRPYELAPPYAPRSLGAEPSQSLSGGLSL